MRSRRHSLKIRTRAFHIWQLLGLLILIDYHQMLGIGYKQSFGLVVKTGLYYALIIGALILLLSVVLAFYVIS